MEGACTSRRFTCVVAPLSVDTPHLIVEPEAFLTPSVDRPHLRPSPSGTTGSTARTTSGSEDPAFAASFVVDDVATWLLEQNEDAAFETRGPAVLLYRAWIPPQHRDVLLDVLRRFLDAVAAREYGGPMSDAGAGEPRVLRRSHDERVIGGVCSGLGRYLGVDPVLLRSPSSFSRSPAAAASSSTSSAGS